MINAVIPGRALRANPESITTVFAFSIRPLAQGVWIPGPREDACPGMTDFTDLLAVIKE